MAGAPIRQVLSYVNETFNNGLKVLANAGVAEPIVSTSVGCSEVCIQVSENNAGDIWIGGSTVANDGSTGGLVMKKPTIDTQPPSINISLENLNKIYINATVDGDTVTFLYW